MSARCCLTDAEMSILRISVPRALASATELFSVRSVVPKQGMVTEMMSVAGRESNFIARAATSSARLLSVPPLTPITTLAALVCCMRLRKP